MNKILTFLTTFCLISLQADLPQPTPIEKGHSINFQDVPACEFVRFVSKVSGINFIFDHKDLQFNVSFSTGRAISEDKVVRALIQMLRVRGFHVADEGDYHVIHKASDVGGASAPWSHAHGLEFLVQKLQYHQGNEIEDAIKKISADLKAHGQAPSHFLNAVQSMQWVKTTNSLLCSGDADSLRQLKQLIEDLDKPLKQVFIEVLVIETDVRKSMDFGLQWAAGGVYNERFGGGAGNFPPSGKHGGFAQTVQEIGPHAHPTGLNQIPLGCGFDIGVIGDLIFHKGKSYLTLGALASALQTDGESTIVLNQKIITQDNKNSKIFVGDNLPFTGSIVQTVGQSQQTTANIEYRDIGVSLSITPMLGNGDVVTLDLDEEISQALGDTPVSTQAVSGIRTTKTNMATHVHVPDKHFLVLSGMMRTSQARHKSGIPWLRNIPWIGVLFGKTHKHEEKRNVMIFVRPQILHSASEHQILTQKQEKLLETTPLPSVRIDQP